MRCRTRLGVITAVLSVASAGCATQQWAQTLFAKRVVEVDERFVKVESDVRDQGQRLDRVETRVDTLDTRVTETRGVLGRALAQAPNGISGAAAQAPNGVGSAAAKTPNGLASAKAQGPSGIASAPAQAPNTVAARTTISERRPSRSPDERPRDVRTLIGVVQVPFGFDRADVDAEAEVALAALVKELRDNPSITIDLEGTTDPRGRLDYNIRLSQRRVETVKRWLVDRGVDQARIVGSAGRGPLLDDTVKDDVKRRVMVKMMAPGD